MFEHVVVPLDGSDLSASALPVALKICKASGAALRIVSYVPADELDSRRIRVEDQVALATSTAGPGLTELTIAVTSPMLNIEEELAATVARWQRVVVCMATHGRSRSEAVLGSVASRLLQFVETPIVLVGPNCDADSFEPDGHLVVAIDGGRTSEAILAPARWWAAKFGSPLEIVTVLAPQTARVGTSDMTRSDVGESIQVERQAHIAQKELGRLVNFEVLHGKKPAKVLLEHLDSSGAKIMAMATHGSTGLSRAAAGSVTSDVVRKAKCPVLVLRPS